MNDQLLSELLKELREHHAYIVERNQKQDERNERLDQIIKELKVVMQTAFGAIMPPTSMGPVTPPERPQ